MNKRIVLMAALFFLVCGNANAAKTLMTQEDQIMFMVGGQVHTLKGMFQNTYEIDGDKITRTLVRNMFTKKDVKDNTVYKMDLEKLPDAVKKIPGTESMIQAYASLSPQEMDILVIDKTTVRVIRTKGTDVTISLQKRLN
jgi:hypothetical protein